VRIRMKRAKATDPNQLLQEKENPHDREIIAELKPQPKMSSFRSGGRMPLLELISILYCGAKG